MVLKQKQNPNIHQEKPKTNPITMPHFYIYLENVQLQPIKTNQHQTQQSKQKHQLVLSFISVHCTYKSISHSFMVFKLNGNHLICLVILSIDINYGF
jgi:type VI protein secretion system component Hcp